MRRMLGPQLPALSFHFGLRPDDIDTMTVSEIDHYLKALLTIQDKSA